MGLRNAQGSCEHRIDNKLTNRLTVAAYTGLGDHGPPLENGTSG